MGDVKMSIVTTVTRMWLTKSFKPFVFHDEFDQVLNYEECEQLGLYIHIPFCKTICNFCPYCKDVYQEQKCNEYIDSLLKEIHLVGSKLHHKKQVTSLYFGGGTPALIAPRLHEIINVVSSYFTITQGIGLELHPNNVQVLVLNQLKAAGVTKISIGIQSFQNKYQSLLGRNTVDIETMSLALKEVSFETVSMDFIFALPNQTFEDLKLDIDLAFQNGANHIAIYPFIDFTFTTTKVQGLPKKEKRKLLDQITLYCLHKGYTRNSIWTFSKEKQANYSSMTRDNFLGFGCSATTLLKDQFKINTFSIDEYCKRIKKNKLPTSLTLRFTMGQRKIYYLFWSAYSTKVSEKEYAIFFNESLKKRYWLELKLAKAFKCIEEENGMYRMTLKGAFYYHHYENFYTLAYIDKMWGMMKKEAFPKKIKF